MEYVKGKVIDLWSSVAEIANSSISPHQVSIAVATGIIGALWPVPMTSFIGCLLLQTIVGIFDTVDARQMALVQVVNMLMTPLHLYYFPTFISIGEDVLGVPAKNKFDASNLVESLNNDFIGTVSSSTYGLMHGLFAWAIIAPFGLVFFYAFFIPAFRIMLREDPDTSGNTKKEK